MRNFSLRSLFIWLAAFSLLLVFLTFLSLTRFSKEADVLVKAEANRHGSYLLADMLRQSSDDLTRLARTYVVTGDAQFENQYWEVVAIRNGEKPMPEAYHRIYWDFVAAGQTNPRPVGKKAALLDLMKEAGFSEAEFAKLNESKNNSDALVHIETIAMNAVKGKFDDGKGGFTRQGAPDLEMARRLMHDATYHAEKAKIMKPVDAFFTLMEERTLSAVEKAEKSKRFAQWQVWGAILLNFIGLLVGLGFAYRKLLRVIGGEPDAASLAVQQVAEGDLRVSKVQAIADSLLDHLKKMQQKLGLAMIQVSKNAHAVEKGAEEISTSIEQQAASSSQMSVSITEITSTMEELSASSSQIAEHSHSVVAIANQGWESSKVSLQAIEDVLSRMAEIKTQNQHSMEEIVALGTKSKQIGKVMEIINAIADQTRLIAFNAALEASSAGESGRRFSVVANEIRRLADNVSASTEEISTGINEIQESIHRLVLTSEKGVASIAEGMTATTATSERLEEMVSAAGQTNSAAQQISLSTQQQKTASSQVLVALREIVHASSSTAQSIQRISTISQELSDLSSDLNGAVDAFRINEQ